MLPNDIEAESFRLIEELLDYQALVREKKLDTACWPLLRRMIHACGDIDIIHTVKFSKNIIGAAVKALQESADIVCDVNMTAMGLSRQIKAQHTVHCFISNPDVARKASERATTRARQAMLYAAERYPRGVYVIGNAPTALLTLLELVNKRMVFPSLVIGIPVGFVMAAESKEQLSNTFLPYVTNLGNKGGSPMAAAAMNALGILALHPHA